MLNEVSAVALPASLGQKRVAAVTVHFQEWIQGYPAGADAGYGYGHPRPRVLGPNPSAHYEQQLRELSAAAGAKGAAFNQLSDADKRAIVADALVKAKVTSLPSSPNGQHIVADLLSFFYNSSAGEDFLYNAAIKREDCRGLSSSGRPPARLS